MDSYFAVAAPGLEPYLRAELQGLALVAEDVAGSVQAADETDVGGVAFRGRREALYRANLNLRTATRVLARLGNFFYARTPDELRERSARLPWERFLIPGRPISIRVSYRKSRLNRTRTITEAVLSAVVERLGAPYSHPTLAHEVDADEAQLVLVRIDADRCTVSIDSSGLPLYKRGYRQALAKAPLRETLAAGVLSASGWNPASPLLDPFCGSGTIAIEAAMMALDLPPGAGRRFAFMNWPDFDPALWKRLLEQPGRPLCDTPTIFASDRDAGAIRAAQANAERAGVGDRIEFTRRALSAVEPPPQPGWVVTNPPYGLRIGDAHDLRNLYAQLGNVLRARCAGWHLAVLCSEPRLLAQIGIDLDTSLVLDNGGVRVRLGRGRI